jgi:hypothetical protein
MVTTAGLTKITGFTYEDIVKFRKQGMPYKTINNVIKYDYVVCVQWIKANNNIKGIRRVKV